MSNYKEINVDQGSDYTETIYITDPVTGQPANVTLWTFSSQIRKSYYSQNVTTYFTQVSSNTNGGVVNLRLSGANTVNLTWGRYVYDVVSTDLSGNMKRQQEGIINLYPGVTH